MIIISYDISDNKTRTKFSKYIRRFGHKLQFSVYEIDNSPRILENIMADINSRFMPKFKETDSILVMNLTESCEIIRMGYAEHEEEDLIIARLANLGLNLMFFQRIIVMRHSMKLNIEQ